MMVKELWVIDTAGVGVKLEALSGTQSSQAAVSSQGEGSASTGRILSSLPAGRQHLWVSIEHGSSATGGAWRAASTTGVTRTQSWS